MILSLDEMNQTHLGRLLKMYMSRTSLSIQWLRQCSSNAGAWVQSLDREQDPTDALHSQKIKIKCTCLDLISGDTDSVDAGEGPKIYSSMKIYR